MLRKFTIQPRASANRSVFFNSVITALFIFFISPLSLSAQVEQAPDIRIWTECVEDLGNGSFKAFFGYDNPGNETYTVDQTKSVLVYNGSEQKWDAMAIFLPGTHNYAVDRVLQGTDRVKWRLTLPNGNVQEVTADAQTNLCGSPVLSVTVSGPSTALVGDRVTYHYDVTHVMNSGQSAVSGVTIVDNIAGDVSYVEGDDGDNQLEYGETWKFTASYRIISLEPASLVNTVYVNGTDSQGNAIPEATGSHTISVDQNFRPAYLPPEGGKSFNLIGPELTSLYEAYQFSWFTPPAEDSVFQINETDGTVLTEIVVLPGKYSETAMFLANTYALSPEPESYESSLSILVWFEINKLVELNAQAGLINFARPVYPAISNAGIVQTQGDKSLRSDFVRLGYDLDGTGVKIGVISNSFATKTGQAQTDISNGDLPSAGVTLVDNKDYPGKASDEGRAMLQIIHDIAPGAELYFRTGYISPADMAQGIRNMADLGLDIIADDITYITEPFFHDGILARAVDYAAAKGVSYFVSAGNFGSASFTGVFDGTAYPVDENREAHQFATGDIYQGITLKPGTYTIVLQWDGGSPAITDLDIFLSGEDGTSLVGFNRDNTGGDPVEVLPFTITGTEINTNILITGTPGNTVNFKYVVFRGFNNFAITEDNSYPNPDKSTILGQANALGAITVGAVRYDNTPAYDGSLQLMSFSSTGGIRMTGEPSPRYKPDFVAPNGGNTTVDLGGIDFEGDGKPNFFGTSAAAPHAAAVAALILEAKDLYDEGFPSLEGLPDPATPELLRNLMKASALDMKTGYFVDNGTRIA